MTRLTSSPGEEQEAAFSPDGRFVSFVRNNNLFVVDLATQRERQLTTDGNENMLNGIFDWVYQEEVYGRGNFRGYWWSPDTSSTCSSKNVRSSDLRSSITSLRCSGSSLSSIRSLDIPTRSPSSSQ
jgi:hypothetical protein